MEQAESGRLRLFVALWLSRPWVEALGSCQMRLRRAVRPRVARWVRPEQLHLTLAFLGDVDRGAVGAVRDAVAAGVRGLPSLSLLPGPLGVFPGWERPRVLWMGVSAQPYELSVLAERVRESLARQGFSFDEKPFQAHITLARFSEPLTGSERELLRGAVCAIEEPSPVGAVAVVSSRLQRGGPVYEEVARVALGEESYGV